MVFSRQSSVEFASLIVTATPETQILKGFFIDLHGCIDIKNHLMQTFFFVQFIGPRGVRISSISVGTILWRGEGYNLPPINSCRVNYSTLEKSSKIDKYLLPEFRVVITRDQSPCP